jgi:hypothetical protein
MIMYDFPRSTFTWRSHPWTGDPYYRYPGGFVGQPGDAYHVRFNLEAACTIRNDATGQVTELFLGAPCRIEYTIAMRNLFQVPSSEFRMPFSRRYRLALATEPSSVREEVTVARLDEAFHEHKINLRSHAQVRELGDTASIIEATLAGDLLNAVSTYHDAARGLTVSLEYPVNLINLNVAGGEFQVCTGPLILPDLATWDGEEVARVFLAHAAFSAFDHVEFILQREVDAAPEARAWLDAPRGRDRLELLDPAKRPPGYPPPRPRPTVYHETWELPATNVVLCAGG